jgi:hypothetical protein
MANGSSSALEDVLEPDEDAVPRRLAELGIPHEAIAESIRIGHYKADFTTAAHPRTYHGTVVWGELSGALRGELSKLAWTLDDTDNISRVISPDGHVIVVAVRGNERTGLRSKHELLSTRRPRGRAGVRIVRMNAQFELLLQEGQRDPGDDLIAGLGGTWFLLYNRVGDIVRNELSFAKAVSDSGELLQWKERLILPDIDLLAPPPDATFDFTPFDVDVRVSRRAG